MRRYKPAMVNVETPWNNISVPMVQASMVECEDGGYIKYLPLHEAAPKMYAALEHIMNNQALGSPLSLSINNLLAEARGEL